MVRRRTAAVRLPVWADGFVESDWPGACVWERYSSWATGLASTEMPTLDRLIVQRQVRRSIMARHASCPLHS